MAGVERVRGEQPSEDERYLLGIEREAEVTAIARIEETAKLLSASIAGVTGLFVAAAKVGGLAVTAGARDLLIWSVLLWCSAIFVCLLVLVPLPWQVRQRSPASIRAALRRAMWCKWWLLIVAVGLFAFATLLVTGTL